MYTVNINHDLRNPNSHSARIPANTPYCLVVKVTGRDRLPDGVAVVPVNDQHYRARIENGEWVNFPAQDSKDYDKDFIQNVAVRDENTLVVTCQPGRGRKNSAILLYTSAGGKPSADGIVYIFLDLTFDPRCENNPANGGIELSGEYEDGTTFSYLINALDNSAQA